MAGRRRHGMVVAGVALAAALGVTAACSGGSGSGGDGGDDASGCCRGDAVELDLLVGSELLDMQPILDRAAEDTDVTVTLHPIGTLDGVRRVADGDVGDVDGVWFSSNRYLRLAGAEEAIRREETIMSSPVIVGLAADKAEELGVGGDAGATWAALAEAAGAGRFSYGMTDPASSNSGLSALIGVATALSGEGDPVDLEDIEAAAPALRRFFSARRLTDDTSGDLANRFVAALDGSGPGPVVDGLVNYESVLLSLNEDRLDRPLTLLYPTDGVVVADYPLTLLPDATEEAADGYDRLARWLRTPEVQRDIVADTHRRPGVAGIEPAGEFGDAALVELPFPADRRVFDQLVEAYYDRLRRPVRMVYVLDVSGSMEEDDRIGQLRAALVTLTGAGEEPGEGANPAHPFRAREEVTLLPFSTRPGTPRTFAIPEEGGEQARADIRAAAEGLTIGGDTAIYDSLTEAYALLDGADDGWAPAIVVMTDGENNTGADFATFAQSHTALPAALRDVPVHVVHLGDANVAEMDQLAALTGQEPIDASDDGLQTAFENIREAQ